MPQKTIILYTTPFFWGYKMTNMGYLVRRKSGGGVIKLNEPLKGLKLIVDIIYG